MPDDLQVLNLSISYKAHFPIRSTNCILIFIQHLLPLSIMQFSKVFSILANKVFTLKVLDELSFGKLPFLLLLFFFNFYFYFILLYNTVLVLPYIDMNPPQVYMSSQPWTLRPPPLPYHPSGSPQCTSPKHPVSCIEHGLAIHFIYDIIHVSMPFSQIIPPSPSPSESKRLFYTSVSLLLSRIQGYHYHLFKFHIYALVYCIGVFLSVLLHSV